MCIMPQIMSGMVHTHFSTLKPIDIKARLG